MNRDFYSTMAQVLPVLLLALVWDSNYLHRLRAQQRRSRRVDPGGVWFWTKPRVRVYSLFVTAVLIGEIAVSLLVLAGTMADAAWLRGGVGDGVAACFGDVDGPDRVRHRRRHPDVTPVGGVIRTRRCPG